MHRIRTCEDCGKRLGGTVGKCFECGGEKPFPSREELLEDARMWKIVFAGLQPSLVEEAHEQ